MSESILDRIAAGDQTAVKQCMNHYGGLVWSLARRYSDSPTDAEDASQEIFLEIWKSAARFDSSKGSETVFITTIARRRLIDRLRSRKRQPEMEEFDETTPVPSDARETSAVVLSAEVESAKAALGALDAGQREVLLLGVVQGMTHSEIATHTGRPLGTVKTQMRRGLKKVRSLLADEEGADHG